MILVAHPDGRMEFGDRIFRCAIGRSGVVAAEAKREGDGASPVGVWPIRRLLYRPDVGRPVTRLPAAPIARDDGWCDAPDDPAYNRPVKLPYPASCETMWRDDRIYDLVVVLGHNDDPPQPHLGSCIFLHLARDDFSPTQGCVALARPDLEAVLRDVMLGDAVQIAAH